ncbi:HEAT repeat domain-containing protein [Kitasatospora sp. NBC_00458]|uniref:HEAT repeat domain-containing protein n=1 Tax=Kitasatospora sp. NBC_00458 TaxID=2903568 RepID=UPI002E174BA6
MTPWPWKRKPAAPAADPLPGRRTAAGAAEPARVRVDARGRDTVAAGRDVAHSALGADSRAVHNDLSGSTVQGPVIMDAEAVHIHHHAPAADQPPTDTEAAVAAYLGRVREVYRRLNLDVLGPTGQAGEQPLIELRHVFMPQPARAYEARVPGELRRLLITGGEPVDDLLPPEAAAHALHELRESQRTEPARPVLQVIAGETGRRLVVLGDPGAGKSTLAKFLALALAGALEEAPAELAALAGLVPVVIELRQYAQATWRERTIEDFLDHVHRQERMCLPREVLEELLAADRAMVVFDGLDEIFDPEVRAETSRRITAFAAAYPGVRTVVTSREYGYRSGEFTGAGFAQVMLQDLEHEQVAEFVRRWYAAAHPGDRHLAERLTQRLLSAVRDVRAVTELAGNPLLLTILAAIGLGRTIPRERREVYAHAVEVLIERWDKDAKFLTAPAPANAEAAQALEWLNTNRRIKLLERIARHMQDGAGRPAGTFIQRDELTGIISGYLTDHNITRPAADIAAEHVVDHLSTRNFLLAHYGGGIHGFVHRAFLEYLAATDILRRREEEEWDREELVDLLDGRADDPAWHEVLLLTAGKLKQRDVAAFLDRLLRRHRQDEWTEKAPVLALAIRVLAEVEEIGAAPTGGPTGKGLSVASQSDAVVDALCDALSVHPFLDVSEALPALATFDHFWDGRERYLRWYHTEQRQYSLYIGSTLAAVAAALSRDAAEALRRTRGHWDPDLRCAALRLLAERWRDHPDTHPAVLDAATDTSGRVSDIGLQMLAEHWRDHPDTHPTVLGAASDATGGGSTRSRTALQMLAEHWRDHPDTHPAVLRATTAATGVVRGFALRMLAHHWRDHPDTLPAVLAATTTEWYIRHEVLKLLARYWRDLPATHPAVLDASTHLHGEVSGTALQLLARYWPYHPDSLPAVLRAVDDPRADRLVRREALRSLARHWPDHPGTHAAIRKGALDTDRFTRHAALSLMAQYWPDHAETRPALHRAATDAGGQERSTALILLTRYWPDHPTVRTALTGSDPELRVTALILLDRVWPDHPDTLPAILRAASDSHGEVRREALRLTVRHGDDSTLPTVRDAVLTDPSAAVRMEAIRLLTLLWPREPDVPGLVRRSLADPNEEVRRTAEQALALLEQ